MLRLFATLLLALVAYFALASFAKAQVPVLMYHRVLPGAEPGPYVVSLERFEDHVVAIKKAGYRSITFAELGRHLEKRMLLHREQQVLPLPERTVVFTFDDGWAEHETVARLLSRHGMVGTFFLLGCHWESAGMYLTRKQALNIAALGHEIGGHSCTHYNDIQEKGLPENKLWPFLLGEALIAREELRLALGINVVSYAWPFGLTTPAADEKLSAYGVRYLARAWGGKVQTTDKPTAIPRINVPGTMTADELLALLQTQ